MTTIEDLIDDTPEQILKVGMDYHLRYGNINSKAIINYKNKSITFNQFFNDTKVSFLHEALHHIYDNVIGMYRTEEEIESEAKELYEKSCYRAITRHVLENYLK